MHYASAAFTASFTHQTGLDDQTERIFSLPIARYITNEASQKSQTAWRCPQNVMLRVNRTDSGSTGLKWTS